MGDVAELLLVFVLSPVIPALGKEFVIVLEGVVAGVEQVLDIVETYHILLLLRTAAQHGGEQQEGKKQPSHTHHLSSTTDSTAAAPSSPIMSGRLTKKS